MAKYTVEIRYDTRRGCGFRNECGLYLVQRGPALQCCQLPHVLTTCSACGHRIKPVRGWTWLNVAQVFNSTRDCTNTKKVIACPLPRLIAENQRAGLLWVGSMYYRTADDFINESNEQGISRRIARVPREFELGKTWVMLAHRSVAVEDFREQAIFSAFKPQAIEYVVSETDSAEKLERLFDLGYTLVKIPDRQISIDFSKEQEHLHE